MIRFVAWTWAGLVIGVSFLATPVKFRAESLTLPVALDVGRATFHALGRVEWALSAVLVVALIVARDDLRTADLVLAAVVAAIVAFQGGYLIPQLDERVAAVIAGSPLPPSHLHTVFGVVETCKVGLLIAIGAWTGAHA